MSGCDQSMAAKAVSSLSGVPLFRLDMNLVVSGLHGSEEQMKRIRSWAFGSATVASSQARR